MEVNDNIIIYPNAGKEFLKNLLSIFIIVIITIGLLMFLQTQIGPDIVTDILAVLEVEVDMEMVNLALILFFVIGATALLLLNYANIRNQRYVLLNDKLEFTATQALVFIQKESIPYNNITRITFSNEGLMNKLLNCGEVKIELSGMKIPSITLESIDYPDQLTDIIQQKVNQFNMQRQMQFLEQKKIEGIMEKF